MKRLLSITLATLMMLSTLVGCGGQKEDSDAAFGDEAVELEFYNQKYELIGLYDDLIAEFNAANPGIKIVQVSPPDSETALVSRLATNDMPDILHAWAAGALYQDMMEEGLLLDLSGNEFLERTDPAFVEMSGHNGTPYAMPTTISSYGIFCNLEMFEENGLELPTTYEELIAVCEAFQAKGVQPFVFRDKETSRIRQEADRFAGVLNSDIISVFEKVGAGEASFKDDPNMRTLGEIMLELRQYAQKDTLGTGEEQSVSSFFNEEAAMMVNGTWFMADINKAGQQGKYAMIPMPNKNGDTTNVPINIDVAFCVSTACKNPEAALKFIDFITSDDVAKRFAEAEGGLSCVKAVEGVAPELEIANNIIREGNYFLTPSMSMPAGMVQAWVGPLQNLVMTGDVDTFLEETDQIAIEYYNK